jgi:hypothetical protein
MATQEDLVLQQFAAAKKKLQGQEMAGQDQLQMAQQRQQAVTGLSGGAAMKAASKAAKQYGEGVANAQADLDTQQAAALQNVAAQKEQQAFQTSERLGTQDYGSQEAQKQRSFQGEQASLDRGQQAQQFGQTLDFQNKQFQTQKDQWKQQMDYQLKEFNENTKTNLFNAVTAMKQAGLDNPDDALRFMGIFSQIGKGF